MGYDPAVSAREMSAKKTIFLPSFGRPHLDKVILSQTRAHNQPPNRESKMKNRKNIKRRWKKQTRRNSLMSRVVGGERLEGREMFSVDMLAIATPDNVSNIVQVQQPYVHQLVDTIPQALPSEIKLFPDTTPAGHTGPGTVAPVLESPAKDGVHLPGTVEPIPELPAPPTGDLWPTPVPPPPALPQPPEDLGKNDKQTRITAVLFNGLPIEFLGWIVKSDDGTSYVSLDSNAEQRRHTFGVIGHSNDGLPIALSMNQAEKLRELVEMGDAEGFRTTTDGGAVLFAMFDTDILSKDLLGEAWGSVTLGDDQRNTGGWTSAILFPGATGEAGADFTGASFVDQFMSDVASAGWNIGHYAAGGFGNATKDWLKNDSQDWSKGKAGDFILDNIVENATDQLRENGYENTASVVQFAYDTKGVWTNPVGGLLEAGTTLLGAFWDHISATPLEKAQMNLDVCQRAAPPEGCSWAQEDVDAFEEEESKPDDGEICNQEPCAVDDDTDDDTDDNKTESSTDNNDTTTCPPDMDGCGGNVGKTVDPDSCEVQGGLITSGWQPDTEPSCNSSGPNFDDFNSGIQDIIDGRVNPGFEVLPIEPKDEIDLEDPKGKLLLLENLGLQGESLDPFHLTFTFHNLELPSDVNGDGLTTPLDALLLINSLNTKGSRELPKVRHANGPFYDVNRDGYATPLDVVTVINRLNNTAVSSLVPDLGTDVFWRSEQSLVLLPLKPVFMDDSNGKSTVVHENTKSETSHQGPATEKSSTEDYFTELGNRESDPLDTGLFADT